MSRFRVFDIDNKTNSIYIQGSRATDTSNDIASIIFQNYDNDTKQTYDMAGISIRDHFGDTSNNGLGDLILKTNQEERLRITYQGDVLIPGNLMVNGSLVGAATGGSLINIRVLTSGTSYTPSPGTKKIVLHVQGAGGAGGGGSNIYSSTYGAGGGAGGYGCVFLSNISDTTSYSYSIGAGGTAEIASAGGNGEPTSIYINGEMYSMGGGFGGNAGVSGISLGGLGGDVLSGAFSYAVKGTSGGIGVSLIGYSGRGANSKYGSGGSEVTSVDIRNGNPGENYGAGGSGGGNGDIGASYAGGRGAPGIIVVEEY